jgi:glycerophosphoryl diester phosphodiesterase
MPLNPKGKKILKSMKKNYGKDKGKQVFYSSINKGNIKGVKRPAKKVI